MSESNQFCTFEVGDLYFGLEVTKVQEVMRFQEMTHVPVAPPEVAGLINLRGQIVTAIDMRRRLGLEARAADQQPMNVVLTDDHGAVSLLVDEIGDVLELDEETFEEAPNTLDDSMKDLIRGVFKLEERLLLVVDAGAALTLQASREDAA